MTRGSKSTIQVAGAALSIVGAALIVWGYRESQSLGDQLSAAITGDPSNDVLLFYVIGGASLIAGLVLLFRN
jgi:drug/metabolite transporter (DMT)-like permease